MYDLIIDRFLPAIKGIRSMVQESFSCTLHISGKLLFNKSHFSYEWSLVFLFDFPEISL